MPNIRTIRNRHWSALTAAVLMAVAHDAPAASTEAPVTLRSLLEEMATPDAVARFPQPGYQCLQASSYNRASTHRNQPKKDTSGWFADGDGTGFIRTETMNGKTEWVIMEHAGPGWLTKMWTPFFYFDFNNRVGPNLRIYLDGSDSPVLDESLIKLVLGEGTFRPPLAMPTARAGDSYAPIPFAKSCKITMLQKPFYSIINYRAYPAGTAVETFTQRLVFDMESSFGTDIRNPWNLLGYSAATFWYAKPGIIAGQSNAQGYNHIRRYRNGSEEFPATLRAQPRISYWPGNEAPQAKDNLWTPLRVGDAGSFGPEIGFASDMERLMPDASLAIVKYAVGGSGIARSVDYTDYIPALAGYDDKGRNWHPPTDGREAGALYSVLMANFRDAVSALERDGKRWELSGFVWMQGEHEAGISRKMAGDYEEILSGFIRSVRKDLHAPSLPFVIGQINSHTWAFGDIARNCQVEVCRKDQRCLVVETVDLPRVNGDAHFTADGMLTLGSRFAATMAKLMPELVPGGPAAQ